MSKRRYSYRFTTSATKEVEHEMAYSHQHWGKAHATAYRAGFRRLIETIRTHPLAYAERSEIGEGYRVARYRGNYLVYRVNENEHSIDIMGFPSIHRNTLQG